MSPILYVIVSAMVSGIIAAGGAFMAVVAERAEVTQTSVWVMIATFLVSAAKDAQSRMTPPPPPSSPAARV